MFNVLTNTRSKMNFLFAIQFISMGAMEMSGPFWPIHLSTMESNKFLFGFAVIGVYVLPMLGIIFTSSFWGKIGDRTGHKLMMMRALLGLAITQMGLAFAGDIWTILLLRFLQGACAGYIAPAQAYGVRISTPQSRPRVFAFLQVSTNLGSLLGAVTGGLILDFSSFFKINFYGSLLCFFCFFMVWLFLPHVQPVARQAHRHVSSQKTDPSLRSLWMQNPVFGILLLMGVLLTSRMIPTTHFSLYTSNVLVIDHAVAGLCYGMMAFGFMLSASMWARFFDHKPLEDILMKMAYIAFACGILMWILGSTRHGYTFIFIYLLWGILLGGTTPILTSYVSKMISEKHQGYILGVSQSVLQFSAIVGITIGGCFSSLIDIKMLYFCVMVFYGCCVLIAFLVRKKYLASYNLQN